MSQQTSDTPARTAEDIRRVTVEPYGEPPVTSERNKFIVNLKLTPQGDFTVLPRVRVALNAHATGGSNAAKDHVVLHDVAELQEDGGYYRATYENHGLTPGREYEFIAGVMRVMSIHGVRWSAGNVSLGSFPIPGIATGGADGASNGDSKGASPQGTGSDAGA